MAKLGDSGMKNLALGVISVTNLARRFLVPLTSRSGEVYPLAKLVEYSNPI